MLRGPRRATLFPYTTLFRSVSRVARVTVAVRAVMAGSPRRRARHRARRTTARSPPHCQRSEEHTSELQSQSNLVCRLLLEKKNDARGGQAADGRPTGKEAYR